MSDTSGKVKEVSVLLSAVLFVGLLLGMGVGFFGTTQRMLDNYIAIGKAQVTWRIDEIQLGTCAQMLRDGTLIDESQKSACAYFMERAAGLKGDD